MPYVATLMASGVAVLQSALSAGLRVACLNASALCDGVRVLPPRTGETEFVQRARQVLVADFA